MNHRDSMLINILILRLRRVEIFYIVNYSLKGILEPILEGFRMTTQVETIRFIQQTANNSYF